MAMDDEKKRRVLQDLKDGRPLTRVRQDLGIRAAEWRETLGRDPHFASEVDGLIELQYDSLADALLNIDENADINRARLKSDNIKWLLTKRRPSVYGDKIDVNVNHKISVNAALSDARSRLRNVTPKPELLTSDNDKGMEEKQTDNKSVSLEDEDIFS